MIKWKNATCIIFEIKICFIFRSEYWVVSKDVASCPAVSDELSFQINRDGSVEFSKNGNLPSVFMHVDTSLPLWAFWDVYGHTSKIRLIGATSEPIARGNSNSRPQQFPVTSGGLQSPDSGLNPYFEQHQPLPECAICFEKGNFKCSTNFNNSTLIYI